MIKITKNKNDVEFSFYHGLENSYLLFKWATGSGLFARLLVDKLNELLEKKLSQIREQAYLEGYKSGKNHEKKKTKFIGTFDTQMW